MLSVRRSKRSHRHEPIDLKAVLQVASILENRPEVVTNMLAELRERALLGHSPARQLAQIAIAVRCGNGAGEGISCLERLSRPLIPVKTFGEKIYFAGAGGAGTTDGWLSSGYKGFRTPLSLLETLPEEHSFADLLECFLLGAASRGGERSILEAENVSAGTAAISGDMARFTFDYGQFFRESAQYPLLEEEEGRSRTDMAQITSIAIGRLANVTAKPLIRI